MGPVGYGYPQGGPLRGSGSRKVNPPPLWTLEVDHTLPLEDHVNHSKWGGFMNQESTILGSLKDGFISKKQSEGRQDPDPSWTHPQGGGAKPFSS